VNWPGIIGTLTIIDRDANFNDLIDDPGAPGVATYSYDPASPRGLRGAGGRHRRIRKVVEAGENDITYDYYYNESWQVLEVRKGGDTDPLEQYVWGIQYVDAPVVRFRDGNVDGDLDDTQDNTDSTLYYTYDGNFNVTAVVKPDGTVAERYTYDPYGQVTFKAADWSDAASQAKSAYDNEILYCGYRFDPESGNYIARNRYLTPPLGRWLTTDPIRYGDGMNLYQYVGGRAVAFVDPYGRRAECPKDENVYGYSWEEVQRPGDSVMPTKGDIYEESIGGFWNWLMDMETQRRSWFMYGWEEAKGVGAMQGNCGKQVTLTIGFSASESRTLEISVGGSLETPAKAAKVSATGGYKYTWGNSTSAGMSQPYGPTPCYEYLGIPLVQWVQKYTDLRTRGYGGSTWGPWETYLATVDKDRLYIRGGYLVCRRRCVPQENGQLTPTDSARP